MNDQAFLQRIRTLIGSHFMYEGREWVLHEVLSDEGSVVLADPSSQAIIQANLFGEPSRKGPETTLVPLYGDTPDTLSDALLELLSNKIGKPETD
ncbi:MAG: hypothetical protein OQL20_04670 [Sedimenticola sp.]|nr:hypothetical protein [Sedimenticola sp.]